MMEERTTVNFDPKDSTENKLPQTAQKRKVVVVALDISKDKKERDNFTRYMALSAHKKIDLIQSRIDDLCKQLETKEPDAMWIFSWHEYGITDTKSRSIPPDALQHLIDAMSKLTDKYPNLVILGGSVASHKPIQDSSQLAKIQSAYQDPIVQMIKERETEESTSYEDDQQVKKHEEKLKTLQSQSGKDEIYVARNSVYCFQGKNVMVHDKVAPIDEILDSDPLAKQTVFEPGSGENAKPFFNVTHPITQQPIMLGAEVCRENNFHLLKIVNPQEPFFHFVFSDEVKLNINSMHGKYAMQFDSLVRPRLILSNDMTQDEVVSYRNNILIDDPHLVGPLNPLYPFERRVIDELNKAIFSFPEEHPKRKILEKIKKEFISDMIEVVQTITIKDFLVETLEAHRKELCAEEKKEDPKNEGWSITNLLLRYSFLPPEIPPLPVTDMNEFINNLQKMAKEEAKTYPGNKDICSYNPAPLMDPNSSNKLMPHN